MAINKTKERKSTRPPSSPPGLRHPFDKAFALFCEGYYIEAIECLESIADVYPPAILFLNRLANYFPDRINPDFLRTVDELEPIVQVVKESAEKGNPGAVYDFALLSFVAQNYENAFKWLFISAKLGNSHAYFLLGLCCARGKVGPQNLEKAAEYFYEAAIQGNEEAILYLSLCCFDNKKIAEDYGKWFKDLVEGGTESVNAQFYLGFCYFTGTGGVKCDPARAAEIFYSIWRRGHVSAQYLLAVSFYHMPHLIENPAYDLNDFESSYSPEIHGDPSDSSNKAFFLAEKMARHAAEQVNEINAPYLLGLFLLLGIGGKQDPEEAYYWFQRAAAQGHTIAQTYVASYEGFLAQSNVITITAELDRFCKALLKTLGKVNGMNTKPDFDRIFVFEKLIPITYPDNTLSSSSSTTSMPEAKSVEIPKPTPENTLDWRAVLFGPEIKSNNLSVISSQEAPVQESKMVNLEAISQPRQEVAPVAPAMVSRESDKLIASSLEAKKPKSILKEKDKDNDQSVVIPLGEKNLMVHKKSVGAGNSPHTTIPKKQTPETVSEVMNAQESKGQKYVVFVENLVAVRKFSPVASQENRASDEDENQDLLDKSNDPAPSTPSAPLKEAKSKRQLKKEKEKEKEKTPKPEFQEKDSKRDLTPTIPPISLETAKELINKAEQGLNEQELKQLEEWFKAESAISNNQDANSYYWLGRYCDAVTHRDRAAFDFFQKAIKADKSHADARYYLGLYYEKGKAYQYGKNYKNGKLHLASNHYEIAARNGNKLAIAWVAARKKVEAQKPEEKAQASLESDSVSSVASKPTESKMDAITTQVKQKQEIREEKSEAKSEHPGESAYQEGKKLFYLLEIDAASVKMKMAADLGHLPATLFYGTMLETMGATQEAKVCFDVLRKDKFYKQLNLDAPEGLALSFRYRHYVLNQSSEDFFAWFSQKAVEKDDPEVQLMLGMHHYGIGEHQQAITWLDRAKKHQVKILDPAINLYLGLSFFNTNKDKAFEYFAQTAEQGVAIAQTKVKHKKVYDEAQDLAKSGDIASVVILGNCHWRGIGTNQDLQEAEACLVKAATAGQEVRKELLQQFYEEQYKAAIREYTSVSDNYKTFKPEEKSYTLAIQYLKRAADAGFIEANYLYAQFLYDVQQSKVQTERNYAESVEYLVRYRKNNGTDPKAEELSAKCITELTAKTIETKNARVKLEEKVRELELEHLGELAFKEGLEADSLSHKQKAGGKYKEAADAGYPLGALYYAQYLAALKNTTEEARPYVEKAQTPEQKAWFLDNLEGASPERLYFAARYNLFILKDVQKADEYFKKAAAANHPEAQMAIALALFVEKKYAQAVDWLIKVVNQKTKLYTPLALVYLGLCCANGWKDKRGQYNEFSCLQKAAESGQAMGQDHLGNFYQKRNTPGDFKHAFENFQKSANSGYSPAYLHLAKCYRDGLGTNINLLEAKQWFVKMGLAGNWEPWKEFSQDIFNKGEYAYECGQEKVALSNFLLIAGEDGCPGTNIYLGRMYETGCGVPADSKSAEFYYEEARKKSHLFTKLGFAQFTLFADKSEVKAIPLFESISKNESDPVIRARAEYYLALCYKNTNPEISSEYMKKAAENRNPMALYDLACEQIRTAGVNDLAMGHLRKAADQGHLKAQYLLADLLCDREKEKEGVKDFSEVIKYCNLAIAHPDAQKLFAKCEAAIEAQKKIQTESTDSSSNNFNCPSDKKNIEGIFRKGEEAFERRQDREARLYLLKTGGDDGFPPANVYLGRMHEEGWGVKQDLKIAESYYEKARAKSDWFSKPGRELQLAQYNQFAVKPNNPEKDIIPNYKKVAENNRSSKESRARAQYCLGAYYSKAGNAKEAKKYYEKAAKANHPSALADLGNDKTLTLKEKHAWLEKAAAHQHAGAAYTMAKFFYDMGEHGKAVPYLKFPTAPILYLLGRCYYEGKALRQSDTEAVKLLTFSTDQDNEDARLLLGECYCKGRGVLINYEKAYELLSGVVKIWNEDTGKLLKECRSKVAHFSKVSATHTTTSSVSGSTLDEASAVPEAKGASVDQVFEVECKECKETSDQAGFHYGDIWRCLPKVTDSEISSEDQGAQVQNSAPTDFFGSRMGADSNGTTSASSSTSSSSMEPSATLK